MDSTVNNNVNNINVVVGGVPAIARAQLPFLVRALYFLLIGWWFSALWVSVAWFIAVTVIGLPLAQGMFLRTNAVLTLQRFK